MALLITEDCVTCDVCVEVCPNEAISARQPSYYIDPELCTECVPHHERSQCVEVCPADCIVPDPARRESRDQLIQKSQAIARP